MPMSIKELDQLYRRTYRRSMTGIFIVYATALLTALLFLISNPKVAFWVSDATQAEFANSNSRPAPEPTQLAQRIKPTRTVKADLR